MNFRVASLLKMNSKTALLLNQKYYLSKLVFSAAPAVHPVHERGSRNGTATLCAQVRGTAQDGYPLHQHAGDGNGGVEMGSGYLKIRKTLMLKLFL